MIFKLISDKKTRAALNELHFMLKKDRLYSKAKMLKIFIKLLSADKLVYHNGVYYLSFIFPAFPSKAMVTLINSAADMENPFESIACCKKTAPITICLTITKKCNYNCYYCAAKDKDKIDITTAEWKTIIADLQKMNTPVIFFTGGEPLLHENLEVLCLSVTDKSLLYILTNGEGLTLERAKRLKDSGVFGLGISLTAFGKDEDERFRKNKFSYDNAVDAIKNSVETGLFTAIISVMPKNRLNKSDVFAFLRFAESLGVNEVIFKDPVKTGSLLNDDDEGIYYHTPQERKMLTDIQRKANKHFKKLKVSTEFLYANQELFGCAAGLNHAAINSAGELTPCDFCPISFGNVTNIPVNELYLKMSNTIAIPAKYCLQMQTYKEQVNQEIPLNADKSIELVQKYKNAEFPKMFRDMRRTFRGGSG
jgi:MoaA/NifB/PqqE/SkfB family radical SAM enzyme